MVKAITIVWLVLVSFGLYGCKQGYSQGACEPGYLDVNGKCTLAVGQDCESGSDCLSSICISVQDTNPGFCSIACDVHEDCPSGFFCTYWDDSRCYPGHRPPPCSSDEDCDPCQICSDGLCLEQSDCLLCEDDSACGPCQRCDGGQCIDVAGCTICMSNDQCKTCEICSESEKCERIPGCKLCNTQGDCPGCTQCERGACIPIDGCGQDPCFNDMDCPQKTKCLLDSATGINVCLPSELGIGEDCTRGADAQCESGICILDDSGAWCSIPCDDDEQCPDTYVCEPDNSCLWACRKPSNPPPGAACTWDGDCGDARVCAPVWNQNLETWEPRCVLRLPCSSKAGESCDAADQRCFSGICTVEGYCSSVCTADYQCPVSFLCTSHHELLQPDLPEADFGGCSPIDIAKFDIGQACPGGDEDCISGVCLPGKQFGPIPVCSLRCDLSEPDCPDGFVCSETGENEFSCTAALPIGQCSKDSDCDQGAICRMDSTGIPYCGAPNPDGKNPGKACYNADQCSSGICLQEGVCSALCDSANDCWDGAWCYPRAWFRDDGRAVRESLCAPDPGSLSACRKDTDCTGGEICRPVINQFRQGLGGRCSPAGTGLSFWQACENSRQCASGLCTVLGFCSTFCEQDGDCPDAFSCREMEVDFFGNYYEAKACRPSPVGLGQPCPFGDNDCESGICYLPPQGEAYCTSSCSSNDDCSQVPEMTCVADEDGVTCRLP